MSRTPCPHYPPRRSGPRESGVGRQRRRRRRRARDGPRSHAHSLQARPSLPAPVSGNGPDGPRAPSRALCRVRAGRGDTPGGEGKASGGNQATGRLPAGEVRGNGGSLFLSFPANRLVRESGEDSKRASFIYTSPNRA